MKLIPSQTELDATDMTMPFPAAVVPANHESTNVSDCAFAVAAPEGWMFRAFVTQESNSECSTNPYVTSCVPVGLMFKPMVAFVTLQLMISKCPLCVIWIPATGFAAFDMTIDRMYV